ncbi:MAG: hypothetical protein AB7I18_02905 [Candidatus Berkiella sp.]
MKKNDGTEEFREIAAPLAFAMGGLSIFLLLIFFLGISTTLILSIPMMMLALPLNILLISSKTQVATSALTVNSFTALETTIKLFAANIELLLALMVGISILSLVTKIVPETTKENKVDNENPKNKNVELLSKNMPQKALSPYFNHVKKISAKENSSKDSSLDKNLSTKIKLKN